MRRLPDFVKPVIVKYKLIVRVKSLGILLCMASLFFCGCIQQEKIMASWSEAASSVGVPIKGSFTDPRDGQTYQWVQIGEQVWMAENLNFASDNSWCFCDDEINCENYGRLYTWYAVMNGEASSNSNPSGVQGICPPGWHVPSDAEWRQLTDYMLSLGMFDHSVCPSVVDIALKSCLQVGSPLGEGCNTSVHPRWDASRRHYGMDVFGFSALPGGFRWKDKYSVGLGEIGYWWSSTEHSSSDAQHHQVLHNQRIGIIHEHADKEAYGFSVRCVRD